MDHPTSFHVCPTDEFIQYFTMIIKVRLTNIYPVFPSFVLSESYLTALHTLGQLIILRDNKSSTYIAPIGPKFYEFAAIIFRYDIGLGVFCFCLRDDFSYSLYDTIHNIHRLCRTFLCPVSLISNSPGIIFVSDRLRQVNNPSRHEGNSSIDFHRLDLDGYQWNCAIGVQQGDHVEVTSSHFLSDNHCSVFKLGIALAFYIPVLNCADDMVRIHRP